jgi:hypothetical protein
MIGTGAAILGAGVLGAGASILGASQSANAAKSAANVQSQAADRAAATQLEMYNRTRGDLQPYMHGGVNALSQINKLYGLPTYEWANAGAQAGESPYGAGPLSGGGGHWRQFPGTQQPDYSGFMNSPDYQFALQQGENALNRSLAAKGQLVSGNALTAAQKFGQGLAMQNFGNYFNRLMGIAGMGQNAAAGVGSAGTMAGQSIGNSLLAAGQAGASGIVGGANAWNSGLSGVSNAVTGGVNNMMLNNYLSRGTTSYQQPMGITPPGAATGGGGLGGLSYFG